MRKIVYSFLLLLSLQLAGQSPSRINYQGIVRDNAGQALANKNVNLEFIILQGAAPGTPVFSEVIGVQTNSMGLFSVLIGSSSNLGSVNFYSGTYSLQVNLDANGGNNFSPMGSPQLLASVPFALHANSVPATYSNNVLTIGTNNSFTLSTPVVSNPTIQSSGVAVVSPSTGLNFTVDVPAPVLSVAGNTLTLTQGTAVSSATVPVYTPSLTSTGILTSTTSGNSFTLNAPPTSIALTSTVGAVGVSSVAPSNFTINIPPPSSTSLVSTGAAVTTTLGTNSYSVHVPPANIAISTTPGVGAVSTSGTNSFNINIPPVIQYTNGAGIAITSGTVISNTAPDVPVVLTGSNGVTIQSAYPNFTIIPPPVSLTGAGIVTVSPGPAFVIGAPAPSFNSVGPASITGVYPNLTITSPATPSITATGIATVSAGPNYVIGVPQPTFAYSQVTGSLTSGTSVEYITPNLSYSAGVLISGPSTNSIAINSGTNALWSTLGNSATNPTVNFIGTIDNVPLNFRVNNLRSGIIDPLLGNAFFGYQSGLSNTTGVANTAVGERAMNSNTSGGYNVAVGNQALLFNTTANFNSAFGAGALRANTTAGNNSAFGYEALNLNTTGNDNTAMGMYSLRSNLGGIANAGFGGASLFNNVSGNFNSTLGHNSLYSQTTGNNNVGIGAYAGYSNISGNGNVFIGTNSGYYETGSNKFYLANTTTSVSPLIYGDFATGNLAIGTTAANAPLQFANSVVNRKIVLWEGANNDHQYYGLGVNAGVLRYQVNSTGDAHVFYAGTGPAASNEIFRINGTGHFRMGNETGTGQGPTYPFGSSGLVIRRIFTTNTFAGEVIARTDQMTFERDGSNGGFRITNTSGNGNEVCNCTGVNSAGAAVNRAMNNIAVGVAQVYTDAQNIVFMHCIFGDPFNAGHMTEVSITRQFPDYFWVGTVTTTQNQ